MAAYTTLEKPVVKGATPEVKKTRKKVWSKRSLFAFRIAFIYFALFCIPLDVGFYGMILHMDYAHLNYRHTNEVFAFYNPQFINHFSEGGFFGWQSYINLLFILVIAVIGALVWTAFDKKSRNYELLYYWLRVLARYRVATPALVGATRKYLLCKCRSSMKGCGIHH